MATRLGRLHALRLSRQETLSIGPRSVSKPLASPTTTSHTAIGARPVPAAYTSSTRPAIAAALAASRDAFRTAEVSSSPLLSWSTSMGPRSRHQVLSLRSYATSSPSAGTDSTTTSTPATGSGSISGPGRPPTSPHVSQSTLIPHQFNPAKAISSSHHLTHPIPRLFLQDNSIPSTSDPSPGSMKLIRKDRSRSTKRTAVPSPSYF